MGWSFVITIGSVTVIVFFTAMTAYYITRIKARWTNVVYLIFVFSMIVPFQAVMFPTIKIADMLGLSNPAGMMVLYLGFGAGLSVFIFSGFVKSIPLEIEEAATIDGCGPLKTYFYIVFPMLKPVAITVAMLADHDAVTVRITDNGPGLPADRSRLFEPYVTMKTGGTGLGLPIVKKIVEEHGGSLSLTDAPDPPGAMAEIRLPRERHPVRGPKSKSRQEKDEATP